MNISFSLTLHGTALQLTALRVCATRQIFQCVLCLRCSRLGFVYLDSDIMTGRAGPLSAPPHRQQSSRVTATRLCACLLVCMRWSRGGTGNRRPSSTPAHANKQASTQARRGHPAARSCDIDEQRPVHKAHH